MKHIAPAVLALSLLSSVAVLAQQDNPRRNDPGDNRNEQDRNDQKRAEPNRGRAAQPSAAPAVQEQKREQPAPAAPKVRVQEQDRTRATPAAPRVQEQGRTRAAPAPQKAQEPDREREAAPATRAQTPDRVRPAPAAPRVQEQDRNRQVPNAAPERNRDRAAPARGQEQDRNRDVRNEPADRSGAQRWTRGERLPDEYRQNRQYVVDDWQQRGLKRPRSGYHWVRNDRNDFFLAALATGVIADVLYRDQWDQRWNSRYSRAYTYDDDVYYQECRTSSDPAGIIAGALIGGLLGNAAGQGGGQAGTTIAGVIVGGAVGAALTRNMDCEDRSYAYRTYYDGFNAGRPGRYQWRNPGNDHRGEFRVRSYFNDPYGFRCANYTQVIYIDGRPRQAAGVACRQPDGSWAIVR